MNARHTPLMRTPKRAGIAFFLLLTLAVATALAGNYSYKASHITSKSPQAVWSILTAYGDICDRGCKYRRPDLVVVKRLRHKNSKSSWYTWSHVSSTLKEVTYFTHVTIKRGNDGNLVANNRQLSKKDKNLIEKLEKKTGLRHAPAFDTGNTQTTTSTASGGKTRVTMHVTLSASGFLALWEGKIRKNMKSSIQRTFGNIGK